MQELVLGAVAYDPEGRDHLVRLPVLAPRAGPALRLRALRPLRAAGKDLIDGRIDAAWHSPLAWLRTRRLATAAGAEVTPLVMRDTDRDLTSVVVVRADGVIRSTADLKGRTVAVGAVDSPQSTLIPLHHLADVGLVAGTDFEVRRHDTGVGLHGDHIGGERDAARALMAGEADALDSGRARVATTAVHNRRTALRLLPGTSECAGCMCWFLLALAAREEVKA
jgi:hypothetical protein